MTDTTNNNIGRFYNLEEGISVPSVTTILGNTKSEESKKSLDDWRTAVGHEKSQQITDEAADRGTRLHAHIEHWLKTSEFPDKKLRTTLPEMASQGMATKIIDTFLKPNITEIVALEKRVAYRPIYAGRLDTAAVYNGELSVIDYKQSNRVKPDEHVQDYLTQLAAYIEAWNSEYDRKITQGMIFMCNPTFATQTWVISGDTLKAYKDKWWSRVEEFYLKIG